MDPRLNSQAKMGASPGPLGLSPAQFVYVTDPLAELEMATGAEINQAAELLETLINFDMENTYHVFIRTPMGVKYIFRAEEHSTACARCCCSASDRPFQMNVKHIASAVEFQSNLTKNYLIINKPCVCNCMCCCKPYMDVRHVDSGKFFGRIREPCYCCNKTVQLYNHQGDLRYEIIADCCQAGLCCGPACQKLSDIEFGIFSGGTKVGRICKMPTKYVSEFFSKADSYAIDFPQNATPEEKMLLITAGLMIDYAFFENSEDAGMTSEIRDMAK